MKHRWAPRAAVLTTLAAATIAMPLTAGARDNSPVVASEFPQKGPHTLDVISADPVVASLPKTLVSPGDAARVQAASRSAERGPLPDCDPSVEVTSSNGQLTEHELCQLWVPGDQLRPDAAVSLTALNEAFRGRFGRDMCLTSTYRSISSQIGVKSKRGGFAATPGKSMHGWGLAIDLCSKETGSRDVMNWLNDNASTYGWANPPWARRGGSGPFEPWHFEFTEGVKEVGGDYS